MTKKMNIDVWRFIAVFFIVAIHISPFSSYNMDVDFFFTRILGRVAVPMYLMITGYFIMDKALKDMEVLKSYTKKIFKIYLICILLYLPINVYMGYFKNIGMVSFLKDFIFNGTMYHLWYFPALIMGIWIVYFFLKRFDYKRITWVFVLLYFIGLFGDSYFGVSENIPFLKSFYNAIFEVCNFTRNGLFFVPIFIYMGFRVKKENIKTDILPIIIFLSLMSIEGLILHKYDLQRHDSMYVFLLPLMYFIFSYIIQKSKSTNKFLRSMATDIYILHPLMIVCVRFGAKLIKLDKIILGNSLVFYVTVSLVTVIVSLLFEKVRRKIEWRIRKIEHGSK